MNFSEGGVFETRCMFQAATPASNQPARRPTRGSGLGAETDMSGAADAPPDDIPPLDAHAAIAAVARTAALSLACGLLNNESTLTVGSSRGYGRPAIAE